MWRRHWRYNSRRRGFLSLRCSDMRIGMIDCQAIRKRSGAVGSKLDERGRRVFAAGEVRAAGWGGLEAVSEITGLARSTIGRGLKDLDAAPLPKGRVRRKGGGRQALSSRDPTLIDDLRRIVEPATLGCPVRPLLWVSKSHDKLAVVLQRMGHRISANSVRRPVAGARLQPAIEPQGGRGLEASRPRRAVRTHQCQGDCGAGCGPARHLGGHEEERADRQLSQRRY